MFENHFTLMNFVVTNDPSSAQRAQKAQYAISAKLQDNGGHYLNEH